MKYTKFDIFKSWFVRDKHGYWWDKVTDYELELSRMSLTELASELNKAKVRKETENEIIVEHILAARLSRIQTRASWWAGWLSFAGAMLAVLLTFYLGRWSANTEIDKKTIRQSSTITENKPIEKTNPAIVSPLKEEKSDVKKKVINEEKTKEQQK